MELQLLHKVACPYSAKVRDFIEANGLKDQITYKEVSDDDDQQVPCLMIDGNPLLESDDIVQWLDEHLVAGKENAQKTA
jgi:glutaredoxin 3